MLSKEQKERYEKIISSNAQAIGVSTDEMRDKLPEEEFCLNDEIAMKVSSLQKTIEKSKKIVPTLTSVIQTLISPLEEIETRKDVLKLLYDSQEELEEHYNKVNSYDKKINSYIG